MQAKQREFKKAGLYLVVDHEPRGKKVKRLTRKAYAWILLGLLLFSAVWFFACYAFAPYEILTGH